MMGNNNGKINYVKTISFTVAMVILGAWLGAFLTLHPMGILIGATIGLVIGLERYIISVLKSKNKLGWYLPDQRRLNRAIKILVIGIVVGIFGMLVGGILINTDVGSRTGAAIGFVAGVFLAAKFLVRAKEHD